MFSVADVRQRTQMTYQSRDIPQVSKHNRRPGCPQLGDAMDARCHRDDMSIGVVGGLNVARGVPDEHDGGVVRKTMGLLNVLSGHLHEGGTVLRVLSVRPALHIQEHIEPKGPQLHTGVGRDVPGQH